MRIGNSFVDDDTRSAVDTEFGRAYVGSRPRKARGERGDEVRNRMLTWKAKVEKVQRITIFRRTMVRLVSETVVRYTTCQGYLTKE